jgi:hypothetical protein
MHKSTLVGKAIYSLQNSIRIARKVLYRYRYDNFPQLKSMTSSGSTRNPKISSFDLIKSKTWINIAKRGALSGFYDKSEYKNKYLQEIKTKGFTVIENFLGKSLLDEHSAAFQVYDPHDRDYFECWTPLVNSAVIDMIDKTILKEVIGELKISKPYPRSLLNYVRSDTSPQHTEGVSDWHCDRYIPCLKGLYFPEGCDWMPFERLIMSTKEALTLPLTMMKTHFEYLPNQLLRKPTYTSYVKPDTFILCMNSIFHRRSSMDETKQGTRKILFMDWNNQFNRQDLLLSAANTIFNK